ncbi:HDOD domain-containing protein [Hydrogenimonas urashimensis]|uniref:HDOD domain-containing protein n=1 Tax=Hydrogenimonas urashimensis TaxID=2740515 RepID=UPI0019153E80|nr:HDOD domain-containing protein [Hydrogenimonas urashimensis]
MVTPKQIAEYIRQIPPLPESLKKTIDALEEGELAKAAKAAEADPALIQYLKQVVNSAAYGFRNELKDASQIFSALGVERAKQLLYAYMVTLIAPKEWAFFTIDNQGFRQFQTDLMRQWERIVRHEGAKEKYLSAAAIMSAGLVVADAIFADHASDVALLRESGDYDLDTILERVSRLTFDRLVATIAKKWEVDKDVTELVALAFGREECAPQIRFCKLARMLHLLLFFELSRPAMMDAGANAFISFNPEFSEPVLEEFQEIAGIE